MSPTQWECSAESVAAWSAIIAACAALDQTANQSRLR